LFPPEPNPFTIATLVSYAGWPGRSNRNDNRGPAAAAAAAPSRVAATQNATTSRRWATDQAASRAVRDFSLTERFTL
jgi:hypothetical protein